MTFHEMRLKLVNDRLFQTSFLNDQTFLRRPFLIIAPYQKNVRIFSINRLSINSKNLVCEKDTSNKKTLLEFLKNIDIKNFSEKLTEASKYSTTIFPVFIQGSSSQITSKVTSLYRTWTT